MPTPLTGQVAVSTTPKPLSSVPVSVAAYVIKAPLSNLNQLYIGPAAVSATTGYPLDPGDTFEYEIRSQSGMPSFGLSVSDFYVVGTAPDTVAWLASP